MRGQSSAPIDSDSRLKAAAKAFFHLWHTGDASTGQNFAEPLRLCKILLQGAHIEPLEFWFVGLQFFGYVQNSNFRKLLMRCLADWQRAGWQRILATESFRLQQPMRTRPAIEAALASPLKDRAFVANLLLAATNAVGASLNDKSEVLLKEATRSA